MQQTHIDELQQVFIKLLSRLMPVTSIEQNNKTYDDSIGDFVDNHVLNAWQQLKEHYMQPQRHYHNLSHIYAMYQHFCRLHNQWLQADVVLLAIFYHDVIYDVLRQDNEQQSAVFFANQLSDLPKNIINDVSELIVMTAKHQVADAWLHSNTASVQVSNKQSANKLKDAQLFLDIDLSVLGQTASVYEQYADAIRKEYIHVDDEAYCLGRKAVLNNFLKRQKIYFSEVFYQQFEDIARRNILSEISKL